MIQTTTKISNQQGAIEFSDVDTLETVTYTKTHLQRECWGSRSVSIILDVTTAYGLIELLQEYIAVKEEMDRGRDEE